MGTTLSLDPRQLAGSGYKKPEPRVQLQRYLLCSERLQLSQMENYSKGVIERHHRRLRVRALLRHMAEARQLATSTAVIDDALLEARFKEQADKWSRETEHLSSPTQMMMHPSYQAILGMAVGHEKEVIRLMLLDLRDRRRPWFWALSYLTGDNPIKSSEAGRLDKMIRAWVEWGKLKGVRGLS